MVIFSVVVTNGDVVCHTRRIREAEQNLAGLSCEYKQKIFCASTVFAVVSAAHILQLSDEFKRARCGKK